ncbi:2-aminobenzoate-CoA ligase [Skermanella stibiiresistens SB22]|uniref:2-aminobenzoate-CoA ligase n=1 Tax=Skermanella stibiiresistens SB22 TaxID=1385369 RepID=W9H5X9_9PROT|nr:AMP-binding protein [Skermanella stibiiresistens]EWY40196.1 2-aminobenzoate-CoA ligase [Skermanella stibiiresistens SB22]
MPWDTFARDRLPDGDLLPKLLFDVPRYRFEGDLNVAVELVDRHVQAGRGARPCLIEAASGRVISYGQLAADIDRVARVLTEDFGLVPGNRVLLRSPNSPMLVACWLAVAKAGGIVVPTMPLLRSRELRLICAKVQVQLALCDDRYLEELVAVGVEDDTGPVILPFGDLAGRMVEKSADFAARATDAADICLIAFTSGTTGLPKAAVHFHRDLLAVTEGLPRQTLGAGPDDVFCAGSSLAFTYGLGAAMLFPLRLGAASVLVEAATPEALLDAIHDHRVSLCFSVPTGYRAMAELARDRPFPALRACVSAAETLPSRTMEDWMSATGLPIIDTIGSTEMLHTFIANPPEALRPGATGKPLEGYQAMVVDDAFRPLPAGQVGRLAVRGPVGCRYLDDPRQAVYVRDGWNLTGDAFLVDEDGYFWYQGRTDDMIVSSGYNISGIEIEEVLLEHGSVRECAVVAAPDERRGTIPKAFVVIREPAREGPELASELQAFVKKRIAPYKYPREVEFMASLPRTETGKIQRFKLRDMELARAAARTPGF